MSSVESPRMAHFAFQAVLAYLQICKHQHARFHALYTDVMLPTLIGFKVCWRIKSCWRIKRGLLMSKRGLQGMLAHQVMLARYVQQTCASRVR